MPQVPPLGHAAPTLGLDREESAETAKDESSFWTSWLPHFGHAISSERLNTIFSNLVAHFSHRYSKIGITGLYSKDRQLLAHGF